MSIEPKRYIDPSIKVVPLGERLGGEMAMKAITNRFFDLLTNDKQLAQFFIGTDKKVLSNIHLANQDTSPNLFN